MIFFPMVPVAGRPFICRASSNLIEYLGEVPIKIQVGSSWNRLKQLNCISSVSQLLIFECALAPVNFKVQHQTIWTDKDKNFQSSQTWLARNELTYMTQAGKRDHLFTYEHLPWSWQIEAALLYSVQQRPHSPKDIILFFLLRDNTIICDCFFKIRNSLNL